jgi:hypothetical protein
MAPLYIINPTGLANNGELIIWLTYVIFNGLKRLGLYVISFPTLQDYQKDNKKLISYSAFHWIVYLNKSTMLMHIDEKWWQNINKSTKKGLVYNSIRITQSEWPIWKWSLHGNILYHILITKTKQK